VPDDVLMTSEEVLALLHVNRRALYRLIEDRALPARRVGRHWRFRRSEVLRWLRRNEETRPASRDATPRVLVVDDDDSVRGWMSGVLNGHGFHADAVPDGATGLDRLAQTSYDLAIVDLRMPGLDGLSVLRQLRARGDSLPVIVVTGYSTEASAVEALNIGVSFYLTKPLRLTPLLGAVNDALRRGARES
jgi:excisionase family DNA binding protein